MRGGIEMSEDRVEREIVIEAPIERVWAILTEPDHVATWFGTGVPTEIDLRPGGIMVIDHGKHGKYPTRFVDVSPPHFLSYRWAAAFPDVVADDTNSTLVEFTLTPTATGTFLRVVESGFTELDIPEGREDSAGFKSHSDGWEGMLQRLSDHVVGRSVEPLPAA
jgi:uncharacterized protein YndB with AHSA1/START domain